MTNEQPIHKLHRVRTKWTKIPCWHVLEKINIRKGRALIRVRQTLRNPCQFTLTGKSTNTQLTLSLTPILSCTYS